MSVRGAVAAGLIGFAAGVLVAELVDRARRDAAPVDRAAADLAEAIASADLVDLAAATTPGDLAELAELAPAAIRAFGWADVAPVGVPDLAPQYAVIGLAETCVSAGPLRFGVADSVRGFRRRRVPRHRVKLARRLLAGVAELAQFTAGLLVAAAGAFVATLARRPRLLLVTSDRHAYALPILARRSQVAGPIDHTHHARLRPVRGPSATWIPRPLPVAVLT